MISRGSLRVDPLIGPVRTFYERLFIGGHSLFPGGTATATEAIVPVGPRLLRWRPTAEPGSLVHLRPVGVEPLGVDLH